MEERKRGHGAFSAAVLYVPAYAVPVCIMLFILYQGGFMPFGGKTLFVMDMRDQYLEFHAYLRYMLKEDNSIFYCWSRSMGGNFLGLFAYYLASPLSWIVCLFPLEKLDTAILLLTLIKIGLCGVSFALYADYLRHNKKRGFSSFLAIWIFSACYALTSYNMVYSMCLMWLDGVILLPLALLGVEKLLDGKRGIHLTMALAALFLSNYYIGYMAGIFTGIYFLYRILCRLYRNTIKNSILLGLRFGICTVLAIGFSAPLLMPALRDLMYGKLAGRRGGLFDMEANFRLSDFLGKLRYGAYDSITDSGLPAIYCGTAVMVLALLFLACRKVRWRDKIGAVLILLFLTLSFYYKGLNLVWHGFSLPVWFPYRYAFLFSFFLIYMAYRRICIWEESVAEADNAQRMILLQPGILAALFLLTILDLKGNGQAMIAGVEGQFGYVRSEDYRSFVGRTKPLVDEVKQQDGGLYRMNAAYEFSKNDAMLFGYNGMTHYSSTYNAAVNGLTRRLGMAQSSIWNSGYGATVLTESLFAVSYRISNRAEPDCYELLKQGDKAAVYRNSLALPMIYAANVSVLDPLSAESGNPYQNQNILLNAIAGRQEEYFTELEYSYESCETGWKYTLAVDDANPLYLYMEPTGSGLADVYVNDIWYGNYFTTESTCSLYLGSYLPGQEITIKVEPVWGRGAVNAVIAKLDMDLLRTVLDSLRAGEMEIVAHGGGKIKGYVRVQENQTIISSIPYDDGWEIWVDGERTELKRFAGTFLALEVPAGEHEILFSYVSRKFRKGIAVFLMTAAAAMFYFGRKFDLKRDTQ